MTPGGIVKSLHEFVGSAYGYPDAAPIQSLYGDLYETTTGDETDPGTIYKIDTDASFTLLHSFTGDDGANPLVPFVQPTNFCSTAPQSTAAQTASGRSSGTSSSGEFDEAHGAYPEALIQANDGNFYCVIYPGGSGDQESSSK
jgi:uncharacterized repeat protein (TIGR03803 family)